MHPSDPLFISPFSASAKQSIQSVPTATPTNANRVHTAIGYTEELVSTIHKLLSELEMRLSPVLTPTGPSGEANGTPKAVLANSPLTDRVASINQGLVNISGSINQLIGRLEI